jgi:hypothetical protein
MNDQAIEQEIQAKGKTAPRVTPAQIEALMQRIVYTSDVRPNGSTTTLVHAFLDGSFFLASGVSACVSVENFDAEIGLKIATDNAERAAREKLWELEGYALNRALANQQPAPGAAHAGYSTMQPHQQRVVDEKVELDDKAEKLNKFFSTGTFNGLPLDERQRLRNQLATMYEYSNILAERIAAF